MKAFKPPNFFFYLDCVPLSFKGTTEQNLEWSAFFILDAIFILDVKYPKVASWDSFFQSCVSRVLLTLVGSPPSSSPVNKQDPNISVDTVPVSHKPNSKPDLLTSLANGN